jgi:energy-coupling factor transport system substrate-specific component
MIYIISQLFSKNIDDTTRYLVNKIKEKDIVTVVHSLNVGYYMKEFCKTLGYDGRTCYTIGLLHDVGKIYISDDILKKKTQLTNRDFSEMKKHIQYSAEILTEHGYNDDIISAVLYHHERYDGSGYLQGLKGEQIPIMARILAIVDSFDALTSLRLYRDPVSHYEALNIIKHDIDKYDKKYFILFEDFINNLYKD